MDNEIISLIKFVNSLNIKVNNINLDELYQGYIRLQRAFNTSTNKDSAIEMQLVLIGAIIKTITKRQ